jgi:hypothetical protein
VTPSQYKRLFEFARDIGVTLRLSFSLAAGRQLPQAAKIRGGAEGIQTNGHRGTSAHALTLRAVSWRRRIKSTRSGSSWAPGKRAADTSNASSVSLKPPAAISRPHTAEGTPLDPALDRRCSPCPTPQLRPGDEGRTEPRNGSTTSLLMSMGAQKPSASIEATISRTWTGSSFRSARTGDFKSAS